MRIKEIINKYVFLFFNTINNFSFPEIKIKKNEVNKKPKITESHTALVSKMIRRNKIPILFKTPNTLNHLFELNKRNNENGNKINKTSDKIFLCEKVALIL